MCVSRLFFTFILRKQHIRKNTHVYASYRGVFLSFRYISILEKVVDVEEMNQKSTMGTGTTGSVIEELCCSGNHPFLRFKRSTNRLKRDLPSFPKTTYFFDHSGFRIRIRRMKRNYQFWIVNQVRDSKF